MNYDQIVGDTLAKITRLEAELEESNRRLAEMTRFANEMEQDAIKLRAKYESDHYSAEVEMWLETAGMGYDVASSGPEMFVLRNPIPMLFVCVIDGVASRECVLIEEVKYRKAEG